MWSCFSTADILAKVIQSAFLMIWQLIWHSVYLHVTIDSDKCDLSATDLGKQKICMSADLSRRKLYYQCTASERNTVRMAKVDAIMQCISYVQSTNQ